MYIKNDNDIRIFTNAINQCEGDVWMVSLEGENFDMKNDDEQAMAIEFLKSEKGEELELFTAHKDDERFFATMFAHYPHILNFHPHQFSIAN